MSDPTLFQYCPKLVIFSKDYKQVFMCRRQGEQDYNDAHAFIGGKMEITDTDIVGGITREKNEEVGEGFKIKLAVNYSFNRPYLKKDGQHMIVPHYLAIYESGEVVLSDEYSEYNWFDIADLDALEPKAENVPESVAVLSRLIAHLRDSDFITI